MRNMIGSAVFRRFDNLSLLGFDVWEFCFRSLFHSYGRFFLAHILFRHPFRSVLGLWHYCWIARRQRQTDRAIISWHGDARTLNSKNRATLVGLGFCQKPIDPACPAGRFNHECCYLENLGSGESLACRLCEARSIALQAGTSEMGIYIMTSAEHIARDLLIPAIAQKLRGPVLLLVCPYSIRPLSLAMCICGLPGVLLAYDRGDCRDYTAWINADNGIKSEQTFLPTETARWLTETLQRGPRDASCLNCLGGYRREGNIFYPQHIDKKNITNK